MPQPVHHVGASGLDRGHAFRPRVQQVPLGVAERAAEQLTAKVWDRLAVCLEQFDLIGILS